MEINKAHEEAMKVSSFAQLLTAAIIVASSLIAVEGKTGMIRGGRNEMHVSPFDVDGGEFDEKDLDMRHSVKKSGKKSGKSLKRKKGKSKKSPPVWKKVMKTVEDVMKGPPKKKSKKSAKFSKSGSKSKKSKKSRKGSKKSKKSSKFHHELPKKSEDSRPSGSIDSTKEQQHVTEPSVDLTHDFSGESSDQMRAPVSMPATFENKKESDENTILLSEPIFEDNVDVSKTEEKFEEVENVIRLAETNGDGDYGV